jgi:hypothetical protein
MDDYTQVYHFLYKGYDCGHYTYPNMEKLVVNSYITGARGGYTVYPLGLGTLEKANKDFTVLIEHVLYGASIESILATRRFDKELEELLKNG